MFEYLYGKVEFCMVCYEMHLSNIRIDYVLTHKQLFVPASRLDFVELIQIYWYTRRIDFHLVELVLKT